MKKIFETPEIYNIIIQNSESSNIEVFMKQLFSILHCFWNAREGSKFKLLQMHKHNIFSKYIYKKEINILQQYI